MLFETVRSFDSCRPTELVCVSAIAKASLGAWSLLRRSRRNANQEAARVYFIYFTHLAPKFCDPVALPKR